MYSEDTITGVSTPIGYGGISIIRISGKEAFSITEKIFKTKSGKDFHTLEKNTITYGHILNPETGEEIDEVLVSKMVAPYSFTAEDVVEINCHGGINITKMILSLVVKMGARLAEAGEFTKRAFLNGRIDLVQAQSISDLITAKTDNFAKASLNNLKGDLSKKIKEIKDIIITLISHIEVTIQYPEYDIEDITNNEILQNLIKVKEKLNQLISTFEKGEILKEGFKVSIIGKPNVGKSMLLNALLNENKAIVTSEAGTTRDIVDEFINIKGLPIKLFDTAGIRDAENVAEKIGIDKSIEMLEKSNLILFVIDASKKLEEEDFKIESLLSKYKNVLVLLNKMDLEINNDTINYFKEYKTLNLSALNKEGINSLEDEIYKYGTNEEEDTLKSTLVSNLRHKTLIENAYNSINSAIESLGLGYEVDLVEIDIHNCLEYLGSITGENVSQEIIDEIFKNFCLGK